MPPPVVPATFSPVGAAERVAELDVLRGVALFGVLLVNFTGFAGEGLLATEQQLLSLPTAALDHTLSILIDWWVGDKANTLFAFLFGLGFYLQMQRAEARGADFVRVYRRRVMVLLIVGVLHFLFVWNWDILHLYGLAGIALLAMRRVGDRVLLVTGAVLALFGREVFDLLSESGLLGQLSDLPPTYSDEAALLRQQLSLQGDYLGLVRHFATYDLLDYAANGQLAGWFFYALGRFLLGAWVGRRGWLQDAARFAPGFRLALRIALPAGLLLEGVAQLLLLYAETQRLTPVEAWLTLGNLLHMLAVPVLATGYLCAVVIALRTPRGRRLLAPFGAAGRMALTNYLTQSFVYAFVLFGIGPGLGLAGHIGTAQVLVIVVVVYAAQLALSGWWLARHRYGPCEGAWRALTYAGQPRFRPDPSEPR